MKLQQYIKYYNFYHQVAREKGILHLCGIQDESLLEITPLLVFSPYNLITYPSAKVIQTE
jgi:hypothetical protein